MIKESAIEKYLVAQAKARGAFVRKVTYQGRKGAPDRWLFYPHGFLLIVELKRPGEKPEPLQLVEMQKLRDLGIAILWNSESALPSGLLPTIIDSALGLGDGQWLDEKIAAPETLMYASGQTPAGVDASAASASPE